MQVRVLQRSTRESRPSWESRRRRERCVGEAVVEGGVSREGM